MENITLDSVFEAIDNSRKSTQPNFWFEMSQGEGHKMYTLWRCNTGLHSYNRTFVKNLSTDRDKALAEAENRAQKAGTSLSDEAMDNLRTIVKGPDVLRFGKHIDQHIKDLPDGYLLWVTKGAPVENSDRDSSWTSYLVSDEQKEIALQVAAERNLVREYKGKLVPNKLADIYEKRDLENAKSQHIGTIGEKIEIKVSFERQSYFEGHFGTTYVNTFRTEDGSVITYFGKNLVERNRDYEYFDVVSGLKLDDRLQNTYFHNIGISNHKFHTCDSNLPESVREELRKREGVLPEEACYILLDKNNSIKNFISIRDVDVEPYKFEVGGTYILKATVKEHSTYQGTKQTQVQRPKLVEIK